MNSVKKCILLNAGTQTRRAFKAGLTTAECEHYATKKMALHIRAHTEPLFLYKNKPIDWNDSFVFTRIRATDQQFCGILYDYFAQHQIPASDPINHSYVNSAEKISQMLLLSMNEITVPDTIIFREESFAANNEYIQSHLTFPLIFKTDGSRGRNVHYVEEYAALEKLLQHKKPHVLALVQPFIPNSFDTRTIVAFGNILGSIKRERTSGYLNNVAQGATPSRYALTEAEERIAINAARVCGIDIAGVDMIHTTDGPIVIEVNKSPQIQGFESVHEFKVFTKIAELAAQKYQK